MNEALVVFVRGIIGFITLLIFTRIIGKQQVSQLTFFDYILGITIGSMAATLTTDLSSRAWPHWVGLATWTGAVILIQWISVRSRAFSKYLNGEPVVLIMNGKIMEGALRKMRYTMDELLEQLRHHKIFDLAIIEFAVLETNGKISILKKSQYQAVTPHDLNIPTRYKGISTEIIYDGVVFEENLRRVNLDLPWLEKQLKSLNIKSPGEVFLATLDTEGKLYVDKYDDHLKKMTDASDYHNIR